MKTYERLKRVEEAVAGTLLVATVVLLLILAFSRIVGSPIAGLLTLSMVTLTWSVFIGVDVAYRESGLVSIDLAVDKLPPAGRRFAGLGVHLLVGAFLVALITLGIRLILHQSGRMLPGFPLPYTVVSVALPVSSALLLLTTAVKFVELVRRKGPEDGTATDFSSQVL